jgi:tRNA A-37 threonylcarbamoyl transferase component Bud32
MPGAGAGSQAFPDRIGRWVPERLIGRGAVAAVYLARDLDGSPVAVKWMDHPHPALMDRFEREIQILTELDHPGVIRTLDHGICHDRPFLAMEFIEGQDLSLYASKLHQRPPWERYARCRAIGEALCEALQYIHARGLVHRDLKPSNVLIARDDRVILADFGVVKNTQDITRTAVGIVVGTLSYAAPEQLLGDPVGPRTDLFGLGGTLYYTLTQRRPFQGIDRELESGVVRTPPPPSRFEPALPADLEGVIMRLLASAPEARPRDAASVRAMLAAEAPTGPKLAGTRPILQAVAQILERAEAGEVVVARPTGPMGTRKGWVGDLLREGAQRRGIPVVEVIEAGAFQAVQDRLSAGEQLLVISPHALPLPPSVPEIQIPLKPLGVADVRRSLVLAAPQTPDLAAVATRLHRLTGGLPRLIVSLLEAHTEEGCLSLPDPTPAPAGLDGFLVDLDMEALDVLGAVAIAPMPVTAEEIEAVVQLPPDEALTALLKRGLVIALGRRYHLGAELFRTAIEPLTPDPEGTLQRWESCLNPDRHAAALHKELRSHIEQAERSLLHRKLGQGLEAAEQAVGLSRAMQAPVIEAEALLTLGNMQIRLGLLEEASRNLSDATALAHAHGLNAVRRMCHGLRAWVSLDSSPGSRTAAASAIDRILPMIAGAESRGHQPEDCLLFATWARAAAVIGDRRSFARASERAMAWAEHVPEPLALGVQLQLSRANIALGRPDAARAHILRVLGVQDLPLLRWEASRLQAILDGTIMPEPGDWASDLSPEQSRALRGRTA